MKYRAWLGETEGMGGPAASVLVTGFMAVTFTEVRAMPATRRLSDALRCNGSHYSFNVTKGETRAQRSCVTCGRSTAGKWQVSASVSYVDHQPGNGLGSEYEARTVLMEGRWWRQQTKRREETAQ